MERSRADVSRSRLGSLSERRKVAAGLHMLVALATRRRRPSPFVSVRHRVVLEQRESLIALAERMFQPAPSTSPSSRNSSCSSRIPRVRPMRGGSDPERLAEVTARCLHSVAQDEAGRLRKVPVLRIDYSRTAQRRRAMDRPPRERPRSAFRA